jgi:hypothetical protein
MLRKKIHQKFQSREKFANINKGFCENKFFPHERYPKMLHAVEFQLSRQYLTDQEIGHCGTQNFHYNNAIYSTFMTFNV